MISLTRATRHALLLLTLAPALGPLGCGSSTQPSNSGQIALTTTYSRSTSSSLLAHGQAAPGLATSGVDSVVVTRIRLALRDVKFKTQGDSANFRAPSFILELDLRGTMQYVAVADVPFGTYRRAEFDVHKVKADEVASLPVAQRAPFQDFLVGGGQSVIITGRVYRNDGAHDFTFNSNTNVKQKLELTPPLEVSEGAPLANVTMKVTAGDWFVDARGGWLDPLKAGDANAIEHNIARSIHLFKDTNRDGRVD